ncbi:tyrosine-type recombinase/integrase [Pseudosulfitobacter pseudonitzschiae]|nr:site-specific integrase [Pseudosulfitobacter pseudonitzschiae]
MNTGGETRFLAPILKHFGRDTRLAEIDNAAVNQAAAKLYAGAKPATINRQLITPISAILTMAAEDGLCEWRKLRRRRVSDKKTRWLTPEEFETLAAKLDAHLVPIIGFMIGTGARVRETLTLQTSTLYLAQGQALLTDTKNGAPRMVRLPGRAVEMIETRELPEMGTAFTTNKGLPYAIKDNTGGQIRRGFNNARDAAELGPDVTPHTIRHTWATWHYAQNRDFGALLDLGGWSKADVANIYRKIAPDDLAERLLAHGWDYRTAGRLDALQQSPLRIVR